MDQTHLHLITNHLAIIGTLFAGIVLLIGLISNTVQTRIAAFILMLISSIGGYITFKTGHEAEETVEHMKGISEYVIEQHEEFAEKALWFIILLFIASLVGLYAGKKKLLSEKKISWIILLISLISFAVFAWTGYLGGLIMHATDI
ncbi:MAG: hypothetical protein KA736_03995 [Crocinitomicaceae bacterium]|nr:hypothetical protein [Crocinitomicaceae bacterium]